MARNVFISHASEDAAVVATIAADLERRGWQVWLDARRLAAGQRWAAEISRAVPASHVVVAVVSPSALGSHWVDAELKLAVDHGRPILTVLVDRPDLDAVQRRFGLYLAGHQWIDFGGAAAVLEGHQLDEIAVAAAEMAARSSARPPGGAQRRVGTALVVVGAVGLVASFGAALVMMVGAFGDFGGFVDALLEGSTDEIEARFRDYVGSVIGAAMPFIGVFAAMVSIAVGLWMRRSARRRALHARAAT